MVFYLRFGGMQHWGVTSVDREFLGGAVRTAYLPALLIALAEALGDLSLLRDDLRPDPARVQEPTAGLSREQRDAARALAIEQLEVLCEQPAREVPPPDEATLRTMLAFLIGRPVSDDEACQMREELGWAVKTPGPPTGARTTSTPTARSRS